MSNFKTSQLVQVKSPIKKEIKHLGGDYQRTFLELLEESLGRLNYHGFKLVHVTKSYRDGGSICSDNFWRKENKVGEVKIVWLCTLKIIFNGGFEFQFDFDMWFDFSKLLHDTRADIYEKGFLIPTEITLRSLVERKLRGY